MTVIAILSFLLGATLGQRFKVLVLLPAILFAVVAIGIGGLARGEPGLVVLAAVAIAITALQLGYFFGILVRATVASSRAIPQRETLNRPAISQH